MATLYFGTTLINQADANVATVVESLTKSEYEALAVKDPNTLYVLTDVENNFNSNIYLGNNALGTVAVAGTYQCDPTPIKGSTNAVQSGGVYDALEEVKNTIDVLPAATSNDEGKFLRVVNGAWAAAAVPNAEEVAF